VEEVTFLIAASPRVWRFFIFFFNSLCFSASMPNCRGPVWTLSSNANISSSSSPSSICSNLLKLSSNLFSSSSLTSPITISIFSIYPFNIFKVHLLQQVLEVMLVGWCTFSLFDRPGFVLIKGSLFLPN
jgi:hypothetical protein